MKETWNSGAINEYYAQASEIAKRIQARPGDRSVNGAARQLLDQLMMRPVNPLRDGDKDLYIERSLVEVMFNGVFPVEDRRQNTSSLAAFLGKVRAEIIPDYLPKPVTRYVDPPAMKMRSSGPYTGRINPDDISDPGDRAKYLAAIRPQA